MSCISFVHPVTNFLWHSLIHKRHLEEFQWWVTKYHKNINWKKKKKSENLKVFQM